ncbi:MAG: hypothetical protein SFW65_07135 [Alphaproteobacteria bacterium]|nr:hypothetical protein [Alphaproteobacteria bacterium]
MSSAPASPAPTTVWSTTVGVAENILTQYRRLENKPAWQKLLKVLDVGMLNSFHPPVFYAIIGTKFGWGAALPFIGVAPIPIIIGLATAVTAYNIVLRLPILFPKLGKYLPEAYSNNNLSAIKTQKAVGLSLLAFGALSMLSGTAMPMIAGAWYGGFSGLSNWLQGLRTDAVNKGNDPETALFNTAYGRFLERTIGRKWAQRTHFPPMLGGISMLGMGIIMTAEAGSTLTQTLYAAATKVPVLIGSALFVTTAAFQAARVAGYSNWGGSFGRVLAGTGMTTIAATIAATQGVMNMNFLLASASSLTNFLVARIEDTKKISGKPTPWPIKLPAFLRRSHAVVTIPHAAMPSITPVRSYVPAPQIIFGGVTPVEKLQRRIDQLPKSGSGRRNLAALRTPHGETIPNRPVRSGKVRRASGQRPRITYRNWNLQA